MILTVAEIKGGRQGGPPPLNVFKKKKKKKKLIFLTHILFCPYRVTSPYKLNQNIHFPVFAQK